MYLNETIEVLEQMEKRIIRGIVRRDARRAMAWLRQDQMNEGRAWAIAARWNSEAVPGESIPPFGGQEDPRMPTAVRLLIWLRLKRGLIFLRKMKEFDPALFASPFSAYRDAAYASSQIQEALDKLILELMVKEFPVRLPSGPGETQTSAPAPSQPKKG